MRSGSSAAGTACPPRTPPPADMYAVFQHLAREGHNHFTVGITDDVTHLSIEPPSSPCLGTPARSL